VETSADEGQKSPIIQVEKGAVAIKDLRVYGHGDDDAELRRQLLDKVYEAVGDHSTVDF